MSTETTEADHAAARELADAAGSILLHLRTEVPPDELRAAGDKASHRHLLGGLERRFPADGVLSEETIGSTEQRAQLGGRVWIVDPLDGTREFGEPPRVDWAVHVALVVDGCPIVGAVALPGRDLTLSTGSVPLPAPAAPVAGQRPRVLVSRTRPPALAVELAARMAGDLVPLGSAGAKAMAVVLGEADVYVHAGGQYEWDSAAPVAVALAAGFHASRIDGSRLVYDQPNPWLPDLLICRPDLAAQVLELCRDLA